VNEGMTKARAAIDIFRAAGLRTPFGFDQDAAEELWGAKIGRFDLSAVLGAANEWVTLEKEFPTISEFSMIVEQYHRIGNPTSHQTRACPECGRSDGEDTFGWVYRSDPTVPGPMTVRPCSMCRPEMHRMWLAGHFRPVETGACKCNDPSCRFTKHR